MWHKVSWLVFWVSMVLWFGNMWGCAAPGMEQNYKVGEPERRSPSREDYGRSVLAREDADETLEVAFVQEQPAPAAPAAAAAPAATSDAPKADAPKPADAPAPAADAPSLNGLDRSHWAKIKVKPDVGVTRHYPLYYKDCPFDRPEPAINESDSLDKQLEASLAGAENHSWDWFHGQQRLAQPVKFSYDTVLLLPRMLITPPWREKTTP